MIPLVLAAALAAPPAPLTLDAVKDVPPLAVKPDDPPVLALRKRAYNARLAQVQRLAAGYGAGGAAFFELAPALRRLADSEADATGNPAAALRWLDLALVVLDLRLATEQKLLAQGGTTLDDYLALKIGRLSAGIDLAGLKANLKAPGPAPAAVLKLHEERVKALAQLEDRKRQLHAAGAAAELEVLGARAARLEAEVELLKYRQTAGPKPD